MTPFHPLLSIRDSFPAPTSCCPGALWQPRYAPLPSSVIPSASAFPTDWEAWEASG